MSLPLEDSLLDLDQLGPVFLMGCPRSGTTLLADCLARLPGVEAFVGVLLSDRTMHLLASGLVTPEVEAELLWSVRFTLWKAVVARHHSRGEALLDGLRGVVSPLEAVLRPRRKLAEQVLVYKEPFIAVGVAPLAAHFSRARFIHIIRDGRDCADSVRRSYPEALTDAVLRDPLLARQKGSEIGVSRAHEGWVIPWWVAPGEEPAFTAASPYARALWMWREVVKRGRADGQKLGPSRYLEVSYESLCRAPREIGEDVARFVGKPADARYHRALATSTPRSIGAHRGQSPAVLEEGTRLARGLLTELGYVSP